MNRNVILVDSQDQELGIKPILAAHQNPGSLHRAISVVLFREGEIGKEILLQRRSAHKPLWPLYWSNTCCTHPREGEGYLECGVRRLKEELGVEMNQEELKVVGRFEYQADYNEQLSEHELDTVIVGNYQGKTNPNPEEVAEVKWMRLNEVKADLQQQPQIYTPWFRKVVELIEDPEPFFAKA